MTDQMSTGTVPGCKYPAIGPAGMVVTNNPLASAAGAELLAGGGNAIDAAIAALFTLTVVEPMMVGILGGGISHLRLAGGRHIVVDGQTVAPGAASVATSAGTVGAPSVAVPGALPAWCETLERYGSLSLPEVVEPAVRRAELGFRVSPYLATCIAESAESLRLDPAARALLLPSDRPLAVGDLLRQPEYAGTLKRLADRGPELLHEGELGIAFASHLQANGGLVSLEDLRSYRCFERQPVRSTYRSYEIVGPPPPAASGVHVVELLNILEGFDLGAAGPGEVETIHLFVEALKIASADRDAFTGDPAFIATPVERLLSKAYAAERRHEIDRGRAGRWHSTASASRETATTTHLTVVDAVGNVVNSTQSLGGLFGACTIVPGTGAFANNYLYAYDPSPGRAPSIAPGKRATSSIAPLYVLERGELRWALGMPGGARIFGCVAGAIIGLIDHGLGLQEAVDAPRAWSDGQDLQIEEGFPASVAAGLRAKGHSTRTMSHIPGGMNAIERRSDGSFLGAACWRADGTPIGLGGGGARPGVTFRIHE